LRTIRSLQSLPADILPIILSIFRFVAQVDNYQESEKKGASLSVLSILEECNHHDISSFNSLLIFIQVIIKRKTLMKKKRMRL
jgi:hypothetical protein